MASTVLLPRVVTRGREERHRSQTTTIKKCATPPTLPSSSTIDSATGIACVVAIAGSGESQLQVVTVLKSNLDLCPNHDNNTPFARPSLSSSYTGAGAGADADAGTGTGAGAGGARTSCDIDPLNATLARVATVSATSVAAANKRWWEVYWNTTNVAIPADPTLERFYYAHSYLIGSASRTGKVAAGLWGPWVHCDSPEWDGDYTLDYNHEANHWGLYANNRLSQAQPQYAPLLAYIPRAIAQAQFYNCSSNITGGSGGGSSCANGSCDGGSPCPGIHFPGHIGPFGFNGQNAGEPWASMSDHSNGVFAALNMIQEWEYTRNSTFLRQIAFPFARQALKFYQGWMRRRKDGTWVNENDQVRVAPFTSFLVSVILLKHSIGMAAIVSTPVSALTIFSNIFDVAM
jgi:hypothetical protein